MGLWMCWSTTVILAGERTFLYKETICAMYELDIGLCLKRKREREREAMQIIS